MLNSKVQTMKTKHHINFLFFCCISLLVNIHSAVCSQDVASQFLKRSHITDSLLLPYRLYIPDNYDGQILFPTVLALHGAGKRGNDNESHLNKKILPWAEDEIQMKYPSIIIAPQCPEEEYWTRQNVCEAVFSLLDSLLTELSIDTNRIYISGGSMGAYATWFLPTYRDNFFAAGLPVSGGGYEYYIGAINDFPLWVIHGNADDKVPVERSRNMITYLETAGRDPFYTKCNFNNGDCSGMSDFLIGSLIDVGADLFYAEYDGLGHGIGDIHFSDTNAINWLFKQSRANEAYVYDPVVVEQLYKEDSIRNNTINTEYITGNFNEIKSYPNPFSGSISITFEAETSSNAFLEIFDMFGRKIKSMENNSLQYGQNTFIWDATDDSQDKVKVGIYFYVLTVSEKLYQGRLVFVQ